jgi:transaldolase
MSTLIEQLETILDVDVDALSPAVSLALPFKPHNMTSNQFLVNAEMQVPENRELLVKACKEYGDRGWSAVLDEVVRPFLLFGEFLPTFSQSIVCPNMREKYK